MFSEHWEATSFIPSSQVLRGTSLWGCCSAWGPGAEQGPTGVHHCGAAALFEALGPSRDQQMDNETMSPLLQCLHFKSQHVNMKSWHLKFLLTTDLEGTIILPYVCWALLQFSALSHMHDFTHGLPHQPRECPPPPHEKSNLVVIQFTWVLSGRLRTQTLVCLSPVQRIVSS